MLSTSSTLVKAANWVSTDGTIAPVCTIRHGLTTIGGYQVDVLVELRDGLVVISRALDNDFVEGFFIDHFKRRYPDFLCHVVSAAEWRSHCHEHVGRCRICQLLFDIEGALVLLDLSNGSPSTQLVEPLAATPSSPPSPIPQQQRCILPEPFESDSSSIVSAPALFQEPHHHCLRSHSNYRTKSAKPQKLVIAKTRSTTSKKTCTTSPKSDILGRREVTTPRTMDDDGPEKALHRAVFDYITKRPTEVWMAIISQYTKRKLSSVRNYFQNRRDQLESVLVRKEPDWRSYYKNVDFALPNGSIVPMRPSALENWPSVRWTDEDFDRLIKEDFIPHLAYIKKQNDKRCETIPYYAKRSRRFPDERTMDQGEDAEEKGKHVKLFKFEL